MPLVINGTTIEKVIYNGVELEKLVYNGVLVFEAAFSQVINLPGQHLRFDLAQHLLSLGWDGQLKVKVTVNLTGYCYSDDVEAYGMYIRNLPAGSEVDLIIASTGSIRGKGGDGITPAERGGHALYVHDGNSSAIRIQNNGWIGGGGGGGGYIRSPNPYGGGFGLEVSGGGGAGTVAGAAVDFEPNAQMTPGENGTDVSGGRGSHYRALHSDYTSDGGVGGARGEAGGNARMNKPGGSGTLYPPGAGGYSVVGNNRITWLNVGTLYGDRVNN